MDSSPPAATKPTYLDWVFRALGFTAMVAVAFTLPQFPSIELDSSWRMAIGRFLMEGRQFGRDVVFTYGPLGFAMGKTYWGDHWGLLIGWHVVQAVVFTAMVYWHAYRLQGYARVFCFGFFFLFGLSYQDAMHQTFMALAGFELIRRAGKPWRWSSLALLALLAILSLVKFTNLMLGFFLVLLAGALETWKMRRSAGLRVPAAFVGLFLLGWVLCGQHVGNLPAYFHSSWEISQGYLDAMGFASPSRQLYFGLTVVGLVLAYLGLNLATSTDRVRGATLVLGALAYLYVNWKHGFIRADGHQIGFYYAALTIIVTSPLLLEDGPRLRRVKIALLAGAGLACLTGMESVLPGLVRGALAAAQDKVNLHLAFARGEAYTRELYEGKWEAERHTVELRKTQATVGRSTLDVLGFEQGVALFNGLNYQPRPVFQSYSAYTPYLSRLNYDYYASDRAPEYVLFKLQTLDGRLPMMDDANVLRLLVQRYTYLFSDHGFALWKRKPGPFDAAALAPRPVVSATHKFGETVAVPDLADQSVWVEINYHFSLLGRLRRFLFRPVPVTVVVQDDKGTESAYRLPEPIGRTGFMLSPIVNDVIGFMGAAGGLPPHRARSLRLETAPQDRDCLQDDVTVSFYSLPPSTAGKAYFKDADKAKFHMFIDTPISYEAHNPPNEDAIDGRPVMVMHAPSQMVFEVPTGTTTVTGGYGYIAGAYQNGGHTNGARFTVYWTDGSDRMVLFERYLDPVVRLNDRGLQHFSARLPKPTGHVVMTVDPGENGDYAYDWTAWTDIEFK